MIRGIVARWIVLAIFAAGTTACTEEKAKALQLTAESFRNEADLACEMAADSIKASVAMPPRTRADIAKILAGAGRFGNAEIEIFYSDDALVAAGADPAISALKQVCAANRQLAAMYTDLPRGYLLSTDDVRKAHKAVVNVTARFARLTQIISSMPNIGKDNAARIRIIEARTRAMAVADEKTRNPLLDGVADQILANQISEARNRTKVIAQFVKATLTGEKLVQVSVDYDRLNVADLLNSLQSLSVLYGDITGRTEIAQDVLDRVKTVEDNIKSDPRLSPLLDADLTT